MAGWLAGWPPGARGGLPPPGMYWVEAPWACQIRGPTCYGNRQGINIPFLLTVIYCPGVTTVKGKGGGCPVRSGLVLPTTSESESSESARARKVPGNKTINTEPVEEYFFIFT